MTVPGWGANRGHADSVMADDSASSIPRVLHLVSGTFVGGGQIGALELSQRMARAGLARTRLCTLGPPHPYFAEAEPITIPHYDGRYNHPWIMLRSVRAVRSVLRSESPEILHTHGWDADVIGALAARGLGVRHLSHIRSQANWARATGLKQRLRVQLTRWALQQADTRFIAVSGAAKDHACTAFGWNPARVSVVLNGIDVERFRPRPQDSQARRAAAQSDPLILGTAARLGAEKGVDVLLGAVARLDTATVNWQLQIAGTGHQRTALETLARELGIDDRVQFLGMLDDMPAFYQSLDIFVLSSWTEGLPRTVLEAMASGLPVIATAVGGTPEVIRDRENGYLICPGDAQQLTDAIVELGTSSRMRELMSSAALADACTTSQLSTMINSVHTIYKNYC